MDIVARVKGLLFDPKSEWDVIAGEATGPNELLRSYVAILAAVPPICGFIGTSIIGIGPYRTGLIAGLFIAVIHYVLTIVGVFVVAFVIDALAGTFGGRKDFTSAFKVAAYAPTAAWVAGAFTAIPVLSALSIVGIYSFYLFYLGLPVLMRTPNDKVVAYVLSVIVCAIIVWVLILFIPAMLIGARMM